MQQSSPRQGLIEPVQDRSKISTRRLIEAAGAVIAERGYDEASLAAIGKRAGYSRGLVTARFGTKENLINTVLDRITIQWVDETVLPRLSDLSGLEALLSYLDSVGDQLENDPEPLMALWAMSFEALRPGSQIHDRFVTYYDEVVTDMAAYLAAGIDDGSIRAGIDPSEAARIHTATLRGIAYEWLLHRDHRDVLDLFASFRERIEAELRAA